MLKDDSNIALSSITTDLLTDKGYLEYVVKSEIIPFVIGFDDVTASLQIEGADIISTENKIKNIAQKTGGNVMWLENKPTPSLKRTRANTKSHSGSNWLGLKRNDHYTVTSTKNTPLFPSWLQLLALLLFLPFIWWREGKE